MRKKNLILLTSITGLLLTLTPSQALAQESTTPTTSQSSDNKTSDNNKDDRLPTDEKCHWKGETPVPENKYLKYLYDYAYDNYDETVNNILDGKYDPELKKLVDEGKMSENEAKYRSLLIHDRAIKGNFTDSLFFNLYSPYLDKDDITEYVNDTYDNPENVDEIVQEIIDSYSLKDYLEYVDKYVNPDIHTSYSSKELHDQYQKEFDELEKTIEYDKTDASTWYFPDRFKVVKKLDKYSSDEEQVQRLIQLRTWLKYFPTKEEVENNNDKNNISWGYASAGMVNEFPDLLKLIKEKGLDNDEFYKKIEKQLKEYEGDWDDGLPSFLKENGIEWRSIRSAKAYPRLMWDFVYPMLHNPDFEIPRDVVCDDEETPGEDTSTSPETPDNPGDKDTTTPTTKTTSKQEKPSNKTRTKSNDKTIEENTTSKDKEEENTTTPIIPETPTTPNQVKTPGQVNTPNNPINPGQSFTPVKNTNPGTFNGGVSSSVEGEELSEGGKVDTGSPTTSLLNKIRTIF